MAYSLHHRNHRTGLKTPQTHREELAKWKWEVRKEKRKRMRKRKEKKWGEHQEISMFCNLHSYTLRCRLLVISIYKKYIGWMDLLPPSHIKQSGVSLNLFCPRDTKQEKYFSKQPLTKYPGYSHSWQSWCFMSLAKIRTRQVLVPTNNFKITKSVIPHFTFPPWKTWKVESSQ